MICHYCNQRLGYRFFENDERKYWVCRECYKKWTDEKMASDVRHLEAMWMAPCAEEGR